MSSTISIIHGDITKETSDVIVNSANPRLTPWGWISWYIHNQAWPELVHATRALLESREKQFLDIAEPVITDGYNLPQKIIHVVGPKYHLNSDTRKELLKQVYISCLELAKKEWLKSISFPSIATGIYWCPIDEASPMVLETLKQYTNDFDAIHMVLHTEDMYDAYNKHRDLIT